MARARDDDQPSLEEWRLRDLEAVQRAIQVELRDLQQQRSAIIAEIHEELRSSYMDRAQLKVAFVPRDEHARHARERREWPLILAAIITSGGVIANLILALAGGH